MTQDVQRLTGHRPRFLSDYAFDRAEQLRPAWPVRNELLAITLTGESPPVSDEPGASAVTRI